MNISEPSIKKKDTVLKAVAYIISIGLSLLTTYPFILMLIGQVFGKHSQVLEKFCPVF